MIRLPKRLAPGLPPDPAWVRYSFAVTTCAVAIVMELFLDRLTNPWLEKPIDGGKLKQLINSMAAKTA